MDSASSIATVSQANIPRQWLRTALVASKRKPTGAIGAVVALVMIGIGLLAPLIAPYSPNAFVGTPLESPSANFLLGTDALGRDVLSRTIYGAQISLAVGITATAITVALGTIFGIIAGYFGGWSDTIIQRALEVLASFPAIVIALVMVSVLGRTSTASGNFFTVAWELRTLSLIIGLTFLFGAMRVIRAAVIKERTLPYIEAAQSIGASNLRIMVRHVLPNVAPYVIVSVSTLIGTAILIEATLSFLGYGVASGTPSWGIDLSTRNREYFVIAPWLIVGPGVALSLTVLGFNVLGDALRDLLDPRLRGNK